MPSYHTHLENRFFEIKYIKLFQDFLTLMLLCRNVILRSHNTVSERDTPIHYYLIILFHQVFFMLRHHLSREDLRLKAQQSHHSNQPQLQNQNTQSHN